MRLAIDRLSAAIRADPSEPIGHVTLTDIHSLRGCGLLGCDGQGHGQEKTDDGQASQD